MRLLLLSYHYPPLQVTASQRAAAWAKYLPQHGIDVTVVSFAWPGDEKSERNSKVFLLPHGRMPDHSKLPFVWRVPLVSKLATFVVYQMERFDYHIQEQERTMWTFLKDHLTTNKYDLVMGIYSPHFHLKHAAEIKERFGIPFVIDFRDLFNNRIAVTANEQPYQLNFLERRILKSWKKWMSKASGFTSVSEPLTEILQSWFEIEGTTVLNGFEPFELIQKETDSDQFTTLHSGTIYTTQDIVPFLLGYNNFAKDKTNCLLVFKGVTSMMRESLKSAIETHAPDVEYAFSPREEREENLKAIQESDVLFFPGHPKVRGMYSSKIFEFIASGRPLILVPSDNDVLEKLLQPFDGCFVLNSPDEVTERLNQLYDIRRSGANQTSYSRDTTQLTREAQAAKMADYLHEVHAREKSL